MDASHQRSAVRALYAGLVLTVAVTVYPFVDRATTHVLADHVRAGYPAATAGEVDAAVGTYLVILTVLGALGVAGWVASVRAVRAGRPWARWTALGLLAAGLVAALAGLGVRDTSGDVGLAPLLAWVGLLPCVAGAVAVGALWRASSARRPGRDDAVVTSRS